ncbi:MAG: hypothetical protein ACXADA_24680 [Candidatus Hodarchaeales archaeon]|jgi:bifunctional DNA-binding transcriptional regulator/antitoxin component of YhaV-PrlF toxin-antitoxin module
MAVQDERDRNDLKSFTDEQVTSREQVLIEPTRVQPKVSLKGRLTVPKAIREMHSSTGNIKRSVLLLVDEQGDHLKLFLGEEVAKGEKCDLDEEVMDQTSRDGYAQGFKSGNISGSQIPASLLDVLERIVNITGNVNLEDYQPLFLLREIYSNLQDIEEITIFNRIMAMKMRYFDGEKTNQRVINYMRDRVLDWGKEPEGEKLEKYNRVKNALNYFEKSVLTDKDFQEFIEEKLDITKSSVRIEITYEGLNSPLFLEVDGSTGGYLLSGLEDLITGKLGN